jgi:hypothetical protein
MMASVVTRSTRNMNAGPLHDIFVRQPHHFASWKKLTICKYRCTSQGADVLLVTMRRRNVHRGKGAPALGSIWSTRNRRNRLIFAEGGSLQWVLRAVSREAQARIREGLLNSP